MSDPDENQLVKQQKYRALRIDHDYLAKSHPARRWMRVMSFLLPLAGLVALAALTFYPFNSSGKIVYEPGPVSSQHTWFNHRCEDCHENQKGKFGLVSNAKCRVCHDGPLHNTNQVCPDGEKLIRHETTGPTGKGKDTADKLVTYEEPRCASCHTEHKGNQKLVQMRDNHCTQCHANLTIAGGGTPATATKISSFIDGHPEWRVLKPEPSRPDGNDPTPIRFNHKKHMPLLYDPSSKFGVRAMLCTDCHKSTESNLEPMCEESTRLKAFEELIPPSELDAFYDNLLPNAEAHDILKYKLTRADIRKLAADALGDAVLSDRLEKLRDKGGWRQLLFNALLNAIRDRIGSSPNSVLASMKADSDELKLFESLVTPEELNKFLDGVAEGTFQNGVVKTKLERAEIRKLAVDAFDNRDFNDRLIDLVDKKAFKAMVEKSLASLIQERLGNTAGSGQNRYMIPITYERNCATECHWHKLPTVKLSDNSVVTPPHGKASVARRVLRSAIYADAVRQALNPPVLSQDEKATKDLVKRLRDELEKKSDTTALAGKEKTAKNAVLVETLNKTAKEPYVFLTGLFNPDESIQIMGGLLDQNAMKRYAKLKDDKKSTLNENILSKMEELIKAYVEDRPLNSAAINALADEKLSEATKKLFEPKEAVRSRNEKGACLYCHEPTTKPSSRPDNSEVVADVHITVRWLNHSVFNHETHRVIDCESCHAQSRTSEKTAAVLLPSIQKCQECHNPKGARMDCIECHIYHDKSHQTSDRFVSIDDMMKAGAAGVKVRPKDCGQKLPESSSDRPPGDDNPPGNGPPKPGDEPPKPGEGPPKPGDGPPKPGDNAPKPGDKPVPK